MPAPSTPEARNLHREAQALIGQAAIQQAESLASHIRQQGSARDNVSAQGQEVSVHTGGAAGQPTNQGRTPVRERILIRADRPKTVTSATSSTLAEAAT
jgi:hypothetical protein